MFAERVCNWNRKYESVPEERRLHYVLWSLMALFIINMMLTIKAGFPFGLLVLLGFIVLAVIRVPYVMGWVTSTEAPAPAMRIHFEDADWLIDLNRRYEALPEARRFWVFPVILLVGGAINMILTIKWGFPFGLLFLLTLLGLVIVRAPYTAGWVQPAEEPQPAPAEPFPAPMDHAPMHTMASAPEPVSFEPPAAPHEHAAIHLPEPESHTAPTESHTEPHAAAVSAPNGAVAASPEEPPA